MAHWPWWIALEVGGLAATVIPIVRVAARADLGRMFPWVVTMLALAVLAWIALVISVAAWWPSALHILAAGTALVVSAAVWRARPTLGRRHGLPPGSLSLSASIEAIVDRDFYRSQARRHGPVFKMAQFHQPVVCLVGLERGHRLILEHEEALGPSLQRVTEEIPGGFLRYMDRPTHAVYGPLFRLALSAQVVEAAAPAIGVAVRRELARPTGDAPRTIDPTSAFERITDAAFLRTLFGVEAGSRTFDDIIRAFQPLATLRLSESLDAAARASLRELRRLISSAGETFAQAGLDTMPRSAVTELRRLDPRMPDDTCLDNLIFIWKISASNTVGLLRWLLDHLGQHPDWRARLIDDGRREAGAAPSPLVDRIINETLRLSQSEYLYRRVREDITFDGCRLPKGWLVRVCVAESHRDPQMFSDPDRFNPDRFLDRDYPRTALAPFGVGRHAYNGVPLTMEIARAVLEELSRAGEWSIAGSGTLERDFRHWSHWRPGRQLRLVRGAGAG